MTEALLQTLTDYGALGVFAGFLVWQFIALQKRLDKLVENFQTQLDKINVGYDDRIEKMRERYDVVIEQYRKEGSDAQNGFANIRGSIQADVTHKLDSLSEKIDSISRDIKR